jgi:hypothetical protein
MATLPPPSNQLTLLGHLDHVCGAENHFIMHLSHPSDVESHANLGAATEHPSPGLMAPELLPFTKIQDMLPFHQRRDKDSQVISDSVPTKADPGGTTRRELVPCQTSRQSARTQDDRFCSYILQYITVPNHLHKIGNLWEPRMVMGMTLATLDALLPRINSCLS